jgi:hypothetical protein
MSMPAPLRDQHEAIFPGASGKRGAYPTIFLRTSFANVQYRLNQGPIGAPGETGPI